MFLEKLFALASEAAHEEAERIIADEKCAQQRRQEPRTTASATSGDKGGAPVISCLLYTSDAADD